MSTKIRMLSEQTINEIAAGEVIENPASVVKELVENALDAGASHVTIEIRGGGRQLIRVSDDGCGMETDDALLCLERHATSKICTSSDIFSISSFGFRGEAIPSIAAISKFTLLTSPRVNETEEATGTLVMVEGGKVVSTGPAVRSPGTTIEVKQLFFNVPVRKKFQRSPTYDAQEIEKACLAFALANPHVHFHLIHNEQAIWRTPAFQENTDQLGQRIQTLLGDEWYQGLQAVEGYFEGVSLKGYAGLPFFHKPNRTAQYLFVNKRSIQSHFLSYLIKECYGTALPTNRHPVFILNLTVPTDYVDVNVHPQKREVRFAQDFFLKELILLTFQPLLSTSISFAEQTPSPEIPSFQPSFIAEEKPVYSSSFSSFPSSFPWEKEPMIAELEPVVPSLSIQRNLALEIAQSKKQALPCILATIPGYVLLEGNSLKESALQVKATDEEWACAWIDQRRAHQRILFEELCDVSNLSRETQTLLLPYTFSLSLTEGQLITQHNNLLNRAGLYFQQVGPQNWSLEELPAILGDLSIQQFVDSVLEILATIPLNENEAPLLFQERFAKAAIKAAVAGKHKLSLEEAYVLLKKLCCCKQPLYCPNGKPILATFSQHELQKRLS